MSKSIDQITLKRYFLSYSIPETLNVDVYRLVYKDGIGKELKNKIIYLAKRKDGSIIELNPYWLALQCFDNSLMELPFIDESSIHQKVFQYAIADKNSIEKKRNLHLNRMHEYLVETFKKQYSDTYERLLQYQRDDVDHKNSALINQMNAQLIDIEEQKKRRLDILNKQRTITLQPPKRIAQFELVPNGNSYRMIADDYIERITAYEKENGRKLLRTFNNFGLVDFYSERFNGEERFIIITDKVDFMLSDEHLEDLHNILDKTFIYIISNEGIQEVKANPSLFVNEN